MKEGEIIKCPNCKSKKWTLQQATMPPKQPKEFLVDGHTKVDAIPGKSFCSCSECGYLLPELVDTPETVTFKINLNPKK